MTEKGKEIRIQGYPICPGIAIAPPFFFVVVEENIPEFFVPDDQIETEVARYYRALKNSRKDLLSLQKHLQKEGGSEAADILGSHLEIMHDPLMTIKMEEAIRTQGKNTEYVFKTIIGEYKKKISKITNEIISERSKDLQDIYRRIIGHLRKNEQCNLIELNYRSVVFAHELLPSDTAEANTDLIEAFVTRSGAETSHVAIMARAKGIPFVTNLNFPNFSFSAKPLVIVDGRTGDVIINPEPDTLSHYRRERKKLKFQVKGLKKIGSLQAQTTDGYKVRLSINIERLNFNELNMLHEHGGEGVGLFRSEYLFLAREGFPSEEEQFVAYKSIVENVGDYPSVIRTFDIGGDKLGNFNLNRYEKNPYLGCRAIRIMLKEQAIFKTQIRAILRASAFGEVHILFPMISCVHELREAKAIVESAQSELLEEGIPFARNIAIGCMIEVPSAVITSDILAKECDFFSIGTNDLVQYALAVDRGNPAMSYLYTPTDPSIIRMIKRVVEEGDQAQIPVSLCGEIAADPTFTQLLLGLGVHELSLSFPSIPIVKNVIRHFSLAESRTLAEQVLSLETALEVEEALQKAYKKLNI
ncbi:MAG: phosphoenolpyruvate--protein phosphotransferase [Chlamydiales bacterium]